MDEEAGTGEVSYRVGMELDALSVDELGQSIEVLREEIKRLEKEIEKKKATKSMAESAFNF